MQSQKPAHSQERQAAQTWQQEMIDQAKWLLVREENSGEHLKDYSFIVFPMAKAYEGFLKDYLFDMGLISQETYHSRRFRIGRALNPDISPNQRDAWWLYDDLVRSCGEEVAQMLWDTWLGCRNHVFHYFPGEKAVMDLAHARKNLARIESSMTMAKECILRMRN